jgi:streptomycin 6-kinase
MRLTNSEIVQVPTGLKDAVERVHGEKGRAFLVNLPSLLMECRQRWSLKIKEPFNNLSYNLVIPARTSRGAEVVLKLGVPCRELLTEISALGLFGGVGAVRLLEHDGARGILLLERVMPGAPVYETHGDIESTTTAAMLMQRLWRDPPAGHSFPSLAVWFQAFERLRTKFDGDTSPFPSNLIAKAERTFFELNTSSERTVILHGDLHHANILSSVRSGWLAIDPKGICGDPGYEVGPFMLNQLPAVASDSVIRDILEQRLAIFSNELRIERERLAGWAFCHAVLSALWDFEESAEWTGTVRLAQILGQLR